MKPDNIIPDITNPQNWNAYSYVKGNPINYNDPSGHFINVPHSADAVYMQAMHSFGMTWFDQFSSGWLPWAGQTAENSWYWGTTIDAFHNYVHNQYSNYANSLIGGSGTVTILDIVQKVLVGAAANPLSLIGPPNPYQKIYLIYFDKSSFTTGSKESFKASLLEMGYSSEQIVEVRAYGISTLAKSVMGDMSLSPIIFISHYGEKGFEDRSNPSGYQYYGAADVTRILGNSGSPLVIFWGCNTSSAAYLNATEGSHSLSYGTLGLALSNLTIVGGQAVLYWLTAP